MQVKVDVDDLEAALSIISVTRARLSLRRPRSAPGRCLLCGANRKPGERGAGSADETESPESAQKNRALGVSVMFS
jgi:hypothetical protein